MCQPSCSVYVQTSEGPRFGPYSLEVHLTLDWKIVGKLIWTNPMTYIVHVDKIVMISPIGVQTFDGKDTEVIPEQEAHVTVTVENLLQNTWNDAVRLYLSNIIDVTELENRLDKAHDEQT